MASPPVSSAMRRSMCLAICLANLSVCAASSLVGLRITARAPVVWLCCFSRCSTGMRKAAVFPEPVLAMHTTSSPAKEMGNDLRCTGVGVR
eukprot:scaffold1541_cov256-Pinguiococcus_pyrenoidosus.AAC.20